jgi:hypothetical protein
VAYRTTHAADVHALVSFSIARCVFDDPFMIHDTDIRHTRVTGHTFDGIRDLFALIHHHSGTQTARERVTRQ